jgi:hypothetical protein
MFVGPARADAQNSAGIRVSATVLGVSGPVEVQRETEREVRRVIRGIEAEEPDFTHPTLVPSGLAVVYHEHLTPGDSTDFQLAAPVECPKEVENSGLIRVVVGYTGN